MSERLEVTGRTLRRDVDRLRSLGYPIQSTSGAGGGYQLGAGANLPPLLLDDEEAVAVAIGLRTAASGTVEGIEEASVRALAKLEQVLPARLARRVTALYSFIVPLGRRQATINSGTLTTIAAACRDHVMMRFGYVDRGGTPAERTVEPHWLVHTGRRWYLVAWDPSREDWRTFRVDRINGGRGDGDAQPAISTGQRFSPRRPPGDDVAAYVTRSVSYAPYRYRATIILNAPIEAVAERIPPTVGELEAVGKDTCLLRTGSNSLDVMAMHLAMIGVDFKVQEPPELISYLRLLAGRFSGAAGPALSGTRPTETTGPAGSTS